MSKMLEEIRQQPAAIERTLRAGVPAAEKLRRALGGQRPSFVMLVARGTSDNAALFGRYLIEIMTGIPVSLAAPSIATLYGAKLRLDGALVVGVSQSGESTDTNFVLEAAAARGAVTVGITNEASSSMAKLAQHVFLVRAGKEKSVAATKTYTGQVVMLYLLAHALGARIDLDDLRRFPDRVQAALGLEEEIAQRTQRYLFMKHAIAVGRGMNYSNAFEFALKLMETCYVVAERFSSADLLHGPIAMVEHSFPAFVFAPAGPTWPGIRKLIEQLHSLKAETLVITDASNKEAHGLHSIVVPERLNTAKSSAPDVFTPVPYIVPAQLFAAYLAAAKGFDPDKPRTLSKVTLTL